MFKGGVSPHFYCYHHFSSKFVYFLSHKKCCEGWLCWSLLTDTCLALCSNVFYSWTSFSFHFRNGLAYIGSIWLSLCPCLLFLVVDRQESLSTPSCEKRETFEGDLAVTLIPNVHLNSLWMLRSLKIKTTYDNQNYEFHLKMAYEEKTIFCKKIIKCKL